MTMDILPILSTLKRHKTAAGLIVLQIALTCAIVCNALFLISQRIATINSLTHMADNELVVIGVSGMRRNENADEQTQVDLAALRHIPGVKGVTIVNQMPFGDNSNNSGVKLTGDDNASTLFVASQYLVAEDWLPTFGLRLAEGRDFTAEEYVNSAVFNQENPKVPAIIINRWMAQQLFPGQSALGKDIYVIGKQPQRVVGVVQDLIASQPGPDIQQHPAMVMPVRSSYAGGYFMLRTEPGQRAAVLKAAEAALDQASPGLKRMARYKKIFSDMRSDFYQQDRSMAWLLGGVCVALLIVTAFGIVGLASFWVQQRTRMIGTRRALGATQAQILHYFQLENFILSALGIGLGMLGAFGLSVLLMQNYELPRLPLFYLPIGALVLWTLGQLAVLSPARRAAALPPVAALRS